ncbi:unnamed protein product [Prorocentrum cordatum]|nr:unnamed protein product [Polarella glacialis]
MGLPEVTHPADVQAIRIGNVLAGFCCSIFELMHLLQRPVALENPARSRLWLLPRLKKAAAWSTSHFVYTDMCQWGTPWKKPTRILGDRVSLHSVARECHGKLCSRTAKKHTSIHGLAQGGGFKTKAAQQYPPALCKALARCLDHAHGSSKTIALTSLFV